MGKASTEDCMKLSNGKESTILFARIDVGSLLLFVKALDDDEEGLTDMVSLPTQGEPGKGGERERILKSKVKSGK